MKEGEVLLLLSKTNGDWWQVDPLLRIASILFDVTNILVLLPCSTGPVLQVLSTPLTFHCVTMLITKPGLIYQV